jgi:transposase
VGSCRDRLGEGVFQVHAVDAAGAVAVARLVKRSGFLPLFDQLPRRDVVMEACPSAHHWGRQLLDLGFAVKLIPRRM